MTPCKKSTLALFLSTALLYSQPALAELATPHGKDLYVLGNIENGPTIKDDGRIIRAYVQSWNNEKQADTDERALQTFSLKRLRKSDPVMARILTASPVGTSVQWRHEGEKTTHYEVEIIDQVAPLPAPANLNAIPENAQMLDGDVRLLKLRAGKGTSPALTDTIEVYYSGWTLDGSMFDSSYLREATNSFPLGKLIKGWQIALPHMKSGEVARIWIPGDQAYDKRLDRPHAPKGMLVFDVELVGIE